jgi:hypothetical protein
MKIEFKFYGKNQIAKINEWKGWFNFHITKHIIQNFETEDFAKVIGKTNLKLEEIHKVQKDEYKCLVPIVDNGKYPCVKCTKFDNCSDLIADLKNDYYRVIRDCIIDDYNNPRHVMFKDVDIKQKKITFIDEKGINVVAKLKNNMNIEINTCFRDGLNDLDDFQLQLLKLRDDHSWYLNASIRKWIRKLSNEKKYKDKRFEKMVNWKC